MGFESIISPTIISDKPLFKRNSRSCCFGPRAPNLPAKSIPAKIAGLKLSGNSSMDMRIPPLRIKIMLESKNL